MQLNAEELKEIRRAKIDVMIWPYARWIILSAGIAGLYLTFWLVSSASLDVLTSVQFHYSRGAVVGLTVALLTFSVSNWNNRKSKLLLKLASDNSAIAT
jgi:hypothetical protein